MRAVKIRREQRILLLAGVPRITRWRLFRTLYLTRWAGELPEGGVMTPRGLAGGCCGHYSFFRWRILLHRHPGDQPVPEDLKAALRGEAPVPERFLQGREPVSDDEQEECGHEYVLGGIAYGCERAPHPVDSSSIASTSVNSADRCER